MTTKAIRRALCLVVMLCVAMSAGAVLKEKNLKSTLSVLRAELETSFNEQQQNMARYAQYNRQQHKQIRGQIAMFVGDDCLEQIHKPRKHQTQRQLQQIQPTAVFAVYNHLRSDKKAVDHKRHVTQIQSCALADRVGYGHNR